MNTTTSPTSSPVRVRLAPSPTGDMHIGTAFLALIDAAFARRHGGTLVVRIEDTDQVRYVERSERGIYDGLRWVGVRWDEGPDIGGPYAPYRQSERLPLYQEAAEKLLTLGRAYRCWCSAERLDQMRKEQQARKQPPKYDRLCLGKTEAERMQLPGYTERSVVRLLMPTEGTSTFEDAIRGPISFENALIQDPVILKSDGFPTYHLAVVVDDHAMQITHVIRGEEWISSTPMHIQLYAALSWEMPVTAHNPLLVNTDRSKISKRKHPWAHMSWFREEGFLPEAVVNYLGNLFVLVPEPENTDPSVRRELFGFDEIVHHVSLERIGASSKIVDLDRLDWVNAQYIRRLSVGELMDRVRPYMEAAGMHVAGDERLARALPLEQERIKRLSEAPRVLSFFFRDEDYDPKLLIPRGLDRERTLALLQSAQAVADDVAAAGWSAPALESAFRALAEREGYKLGQVAGAGGVRVAVTCRTAGPPLFESMDVLGPDTVRRRLAAAVGMLQALPV